MKCSLSSTSAASLLHEVRQRLQHSLGLAIRPQRLAGPAELWQVGPAHHLLATPLASAASLAPPGCPTLLVHDYVPGPLAAQLRTQGHYYADAAGNAWLQQPGLVLNVRGCARSLSSLPAAASLGPARQVQVLRLLYYLLLQPELLAEPLPALAAATGLAAAALPGALGHLEQLGLWQPATATTAAWLATEAATAYWVAGYARTLRPRLNAQRYRPRRPDMRPLLLRLGLPAGLVWGGAVGARRLLDQPEQAADLLVLHSAVPRPRLVQQLDLVPDCRGPLELLNTFAAPASGALVPDCAPPLLLYAELQASAQATELALAETLRAAYLPRLAAPVGHAASAA